MSDDKFDGAGFSREPFSADENAKIRHLYRTINAEWLPLQNVNTMFRAVSIIGTAISKGWPVIMAAAAFGVWAKSQGLI